MVKVRYRGGYSFTHNEHGQLEEGDIVDIGEYTLAQFGQMFDRVDDAAETDETTPDTSDDSDGGSDTPADSDADDAVADAEDEGEADADAVPAIPDDYDTLRRVASAADLDGVNGRSSKADIVAALEALDADARRTALAAVDS